MSENKMTNADQPISPWTPNSPWDYESAHGFRGLTKHEYFAALAMQGYCASLYGSSGMPFQTIADYSVKMADALIQKLEETK